MAEYNIEVKIDPSNAELGAKRAIAALGHIAQAAARTQKAVALMFRGINEINKINTSALGKIQHITNQNKSSNALRKGKQDLKFLSNDLKKISDRLNILVEIQRSVKKIEVFMQRQIISASKRPINQIKQTVQQKQDQSWKLLKRAIEQSTKSINNAISGSTRKIVSSLRSLKPSDRNRLNPFPRHSGPTVKMPNNFGRAIYSLEDTVHAEINNVLTAQEETIIVLNDINLTISKGIAELKSTLEHGFGEVLFKFDSLITKKETSEQQELITTNAAPTQTTQTTQTSSFADACCSVLEDALNKLIDIAVQNLLSLNEIQQSFIEVLNNLSSFLLSGEKIATHLESIDNTLASELPGLSKSIDHAIQQSSTQLSTSIGEQSEKTTAELNNALKKSQLIVVASHKEEESFLKKLLKDFLDSLIAKIEYILSGIAVLITSYFSVEALYEMQLSGIVYIVNELKVVWELVKLRIYKIGWAIDDFIDNKIENIYRAVVEILGSIQSKIGTFFILFLAAKAVAMYRTYRMLLAIEKYIEGPKLLKPVTDAIYKLIGIKQDAFGQSFEKSDDGGGGAPPSLPPPIPRLPPPDRESTGGPEGQEFTVRTITSPVMIQKIIEPVNIGFAEVIVSAITSPVNVQKIIEPVNVNTSVNEQPSIPLSQPIKQPKEFEQLELDLPRPTAPPDFNALIKIQNIIEPVTVQKIIEPIKIDKGTIKIISDSQSKTEGLAERIGEEDNLQKEQEKAKPIELPPGHKGTIKLPDLPQVVTGTMDRASKQIERAAQSAKKIGTSVSSAVQNVIEIAGNQFKLEGEISNVGSYLSDKVYGRDATKSDIMAILGMQGNSSVNKPKPVEALEALGLKKTEYDLRKTTHMNKLFADLVGQIEKILAAAKKGDYSGVPGVDIKKSLDILANGVYSDEVDKIYQREDYDKEELKKALLRLGKDNEDNYHREDGSLELGTVRVPTTPVEQQKAIETQLNAAKKNHERLYYDFWNSLITAIEDPVILRQAEAALVEIEQLIDTDKTSGIGKKHAGDEIELLFERLPAKMDQIYKNDLKKESPEYLKKIGLIELQLEQNASMEDIRGAMRERSIRPELFDLEGLDTDKYGWKTLIDAIKGDISQEQKSQIFEKTEEQGFFTDLAQRAGIQLGKMFDRFVPGGRLHFMPEGDGWFEPEYPAASTAKPAGTADLDTVAREIKNAGEKVPRMFGAIPPSSKQKENASIKPVVQYLKTVVNQNAQKIKSAGVEFKNNISAASGDAEKAISKIAEENQQTALDPAKVGLRTLGDGENRNRDLTRSLPPIEDRTYRTLEELEEMAKNKDGIVLEKYDDTLLEDAFDELPPKLIKAGNLIKDLGYTAGIATGKLAIGMPPGAMEASRIKRAFRNVSLPDETYMRNIELERRRKKILKSTTDTRDFYRAAFDKKEGEDYTGLEKIVLALAKTVGTVAGTVMPAGRGGEALFLSEGIKYVQDKDDPDKWVETNINYLEESAYAGRFFSKTIIEAFNLINKELLSVFKFGGKGLQKVLKKTIAGTFIVDQFEALANTFESTLQPILEVIVELVNAIIVLIVKFISSNFFKYIQNWLIAIGAALRALIPQFLIIYFIWEAIVWLFGELEIGTLLRDTHIELYKDRHPDTEKDLVEENFDKTPMGRHLNKFSYNLNEFDDALETVIVQGFEDMYEVLVLMYNAAERVLMIFKMMFVTVYAIVEFVFDKIKWIINSFIMIYHGIAGLFMDVPELEIKPGYNVPDFVGEKMEATIRQRRREKLKEQSYAIVSGAVSDESVKDFEKELKYLQKEEALRRKGNEINIRRAEILQHELRNGERISSLLEEITNKDIASYKFLKKKHEILLELSRQKYKEQDDIKVYMSLYRQGYLSESAKDYEVSRVRKEAADYRLTRGDGTFSDIFLTSELIDENKQLRFRYENYKDSQELLELLVGTNAELTKQQKYTLEGYIAENKVLEAKNEILKETTERYEDLETQLEAVLQILEDPDIKGHARLEAQKKLKETVLGYDKAYYEETIRTIELGHGRLRDYQYKYLYEIQELKQKIEKMTLPPEFAKTEEIAQLRKEFEVVDLELSTKEQENSLDKLIIKRKALTDALRNNIITLSKYNLLLEDLNKNTAQQRIKLGVGDVSDFLISSNLNTQIKDLERQLELKTKYRKVLEAENALGRELTESEQHRVILTEYMLARKQKIVGVMTEYQNKIQDATLAYEALIEAHEERLISDRELQLKLPEAIKAESQAYIDTGTGDIAFHYQRIFISDQDAFINELELLQEKYDALIGDFKDRTVNQIALIKEQNKLLKNIAQKRIDMGKGSIDDIIRTRGIEEEIKLLERANALGITRNELMEAEKTLMRELTEWERIRYLQRLERKDVENAKQQLQKSPYEDIGIKLQAAEELFNTTGLQRYHEEIVKIRMELANLKLELGDATWADSLTSIIGRLINDFKNLQHSITQALGDVVTSLVDGLANGIGRAIVYAEDLGDALRNVARNAIEQLISAIVKMGIQWMATQLAMWAFGKTIQATEMAAGTGVAAAWAPAAAAVSLATFGANAAPAMTGIASTYAMTTALAASGLVALAAKDGTAYVQGPGDSRSDSVPAMLSVGEGVVNAKANRENPGLVAMLNKGLVIEPEAYLRDGGIIGQASHRPITYQPQASNTAEINVYVENYTDSNISVERLSETDVRIIARQEASERIKREAPNVVASDISRPNGPVSRALSRSTKTQRKRP